MLRKFSRSLERKRDGKVSTKFRFDVHVTKVTGAFASTEQVRVVWNRGAKVQFTPPSTLQSGNASFDAVLSQVATIYKDSKNKFEEKEYVFKLQTVSSDKGGKVTTIGKAVLDMSQYASVEATNRSVILPLTSTNPQIAKSLELTFQITSVLLKGFSADDGMSGVSGISTVTSNSVSDMAPDQDLSGFDSLEFRTNSGKIGTLPEVVVPVELYQSLSQESDKTDVLSSHESVTQDGEMKAVEEKVKALELALRKEKEEKEIIKRMMETLKRQSENDVSFLKKELDSEKAKKLELENQLVKETDEEPSEVAIEEAVQSAIAPYERKCSALQAGYTEFMQQSNSDIDNLHEEVLELRDHVTQLENILEANERSRENLINEKRALEMSLIGSCSEQVDLDNERRELRLELTQVDELMQALIQTKIDYAELSERHTVTRREVCKLKEKNLQLASKLTKIETYLYYQQQHSPSHS